MNFDPQKFFIGLVGFFSVIMPGALLAYLGRDWIAVTFLDGGVYSRNGWEEPLAFLFVAYLLGHFCFLLGAALDELVYSPLRDATDAGQVRRLSTGRPLSYAQLRRLAASPWLFSRNPDAAVLQAQRIKGAELAAAGAQSAVNAYQWAKVRLSRDHPDGLLAVERFEADSKFFRSFTVVLVFLVAVFLWRLRLIAALICALLVLPALWRYVEQRIKATQQAYWHLLALTREQPRTAAPNAEGLTHAGGLVYRESARGPEFLLVESSAGGEWVLPKGHLEPFETPTEAAVREVREEAGLWARVVTRLDDVEIHPGAQPISVRFYLMEALEAQTAPGTPSEGRGQRWLPAGDAAAAASHEETSELILRGAELLASAGKTLPRR